MSTSVRRNKAAPLGRVIRRHGLGTNVIRKAGGSGPPTFRTSAGACVTGTPAFTLPNVAPIEAGDSVMLVLAGFNVGATFTSPSPFIRPLSANISQELFVIEQAVGDGAWTSGGFVNGDVYAGLTVAYSGAGGFDLSTAQQASAALGAGGTLQVPNLVPQTSADLRVVEFANMLSATALSLSATPNSPVTDVASVQFTNGVQVCTYMVASYISKGGSRVPRAALTGDTFQTSVAGTLWAGVIALHG